MTPEQLKSILEQDYNRQAWIEALRDILHIQHIYSVPKPIELGKNDFDATAFELGYFDTAEGLKVGIYEVSVSPKVRLDRNKVGLRNLMRKVFQSDGDAAQIVFTHGDTWRFTYASELTVVNKETGLRERRQTDPKRYTYIFGRNQHCRTAAERFTAIKTSTDLFDTCVSLSEIEKAFSVDTLTKDFYRELSNWYFWALTKIEFPDDAEPDKEIRNSTNTIRLITRLIFVWFLKQKKLIPEVLFDKDKVLSMLNLIDKKNSTYYKAILQNLFFATLNQEMGKRSFRNEKQHYNITNLYRYKRYFKEPSRVLELFGNIPFLNGGLFECLDKPHPTEKTTQGNDKIIRIDGFSDRDDNKIVIPDYLFFGGATDVDLSQTYDDNRQKHLKVRGIIDILNSYNFTVEENTPLDIQVALDPELLGKAFENLLASYNPETKTTARKQTGSFYTPREIVSYMVDESIKAYLTTKLSSKLESNQMELLEQKITTLLSYADEEPGFDEAEIKSLINAVDQIKVLDPACGSGAFPMGVLQQLVHILQKIDPGNHQWKNLQLSKAQKELQATLESVDSESFAGLMKEILEAFENNSNDYGRKLFLIENCIYGVDIQPIAVQIAKLRFFISLICEQDPNSQADNLGIKPLPNLETKFVCANTLVGLDISSTFKPNNVYALEKQLEDVRHKHFNARTTETKRKYREKDHLLCNQIADILKSEAVGFPSTSADQIANWNPYNQNISASFFDKYWMFGVENGFDIVIGNPPYVNIKAQSQETKDNFKKSYLYSKGADLYVGFIERAIQLLKQSAILYYIVPNKFFGADYGKAIRDYLQYGDVSIKTIWDLKDIKVFENALISTIVIGIKKSKSNAPTILIQGDETLFVENLFDAAGKIQIEANENDNIILEKIRLQPKLIEVSDIRTGIMGFEYWKMEPIIQSGHRKNSVRLYTNGNFSKYSDCWDESAIKLYKDEYTKPTIELNPEYLNSNTIALFKKKPKIIVRGVSKELAGIIDFNGSGLLVAVHSIIPKTMDIKYLLGLINSKLLNWFHRNTIYSIRIPQGSLKYPTSFFESLPIAKQDKSNSNKIIQIVDEILEIKSKDHKADTSALECEIDKIVYKLYQLTNDEIKIINPEF